MTNARKLQPRFDLPDLRLFVAIVQAGSLSAGAAQLPLAVSAASARLKNLEARLGERLFERHSTGLTLTNAGRLFHEFAIRVTQAARDAQVAMDALSGESRTRLNLLSNAMAVATDLPRDLGRFLGLYPRIALELMQMTSETIVQTVSAGDADLGVIDSTIPAGELSELPYMRHRLVVVAPRGHPLAQQEACKFSAVLEHPLVGLDERNPIQKFMSEMAIIAHIPARQRAVAPSLGSVAALVAESAGVAILPETMARERASGLGLEVLRLDEPWAIRELKVCFRAGLSESAPARRLASFLSASGYQREASPAPAETG